MQSFIVFTLLVAVATAASVGPAPQAQNIMHTISEESNINPAAAPAELARLKKSAYGGGAPASYSAPPCPKNYLFSCQPNVAPVPCAPSGGGYAGAYSVPVPTYALPSGPHYGIPQELLRPYYY
ncbi:vitelline membrane protein Vm26Aa-like [Episyrphus balteatus]|uniref:vitelline membrane protein Vm26Aa-like n=1 Tax=Episyrphus balteatus TaxID=286459 RepID=UPI002486217B|nr:vitelline membrane protein Vm26Aa-like [Episyrphus balteatus]